MRYEELTELAGVKKFQDMTATEILDEIKSKLGSGPVKLLGMGKHAAAIKIGNDVYKFWLVDSAYTSYVNYCLANQSNPYLPKFKSGIKRMPAFFVRHIDAPNYVNYIRMEELRGHELIMDREIQVFHNTDEFTMRLSYVMILMDKITPNEDPVEQFIYLANRYQSYWTPLIKLSDDLELLVKTIFEISQLNGSHELDLYSDNFMIRSDGHLVIVDPLINLEDLALNKQFVIFDNKLKRDVGKPAVNATNRKNNE